MNIENVKQIIKWLEKNFSSFEYEKGIDGNKEFIEISIYSYDDDEGENVWETKKIYFDKQGNLIPNYEEKTKIKEQIKKLEKELKNLQEILKNY